METWRDQDTRRESLKLVVGSSRGLATTCRGTDHSHSGLKSRREPLLGRRHVFAMNAANNAGREAPRGAPPGTRQILWRHPSGGDSERWAGKRRGRSRTLSKGGKQRSVALPPQAPKIISEYATSNVLRARSSDAYRRADPAISRRAELPEALCPHAHASRFSMIENSGPSKILEQTNPEGF